MYEHILPKVIHFRYMTCLKEKKNPPATPNSPGSVCSGGNFLKKASPFSYPVML